MSGVARGDSEVSNRPFFQAVLVQAVVLLIFASPGRSQSFPVQTSTQEKTRIILDTDIGDDIDDAFALELALQSPELEVTGVTTAWGDTALRARMVRRMLL